MTTAVVFNLRDSAGFFSEFFFLVQSYIFAKKNGYKFFIQHENWPYAYEKGWHDYFKSLYVYDPTIAYDTVIYHSHNWHLGDPAEEFRFSMQDYIDAIKDIYIIPDVVKERVASALKQMNTTEYVALFVRRGDKITSGESPYMGMADILSYTNVSEYDTIFVQSDTYESVLQLRSLLPNATVYHTVPENKYGWTLNAHRCLSRSQVKEDFEETLVGLQLCLQAKECWADNSSNVGRFLKLAGIKQVHFYPLRKEDAQMECFVKKEVDTSVLINTPSYMWYQ